MTNLRTIRRYLDEKVKLMLIKQLIISKLDYCNTLYMNLTKTRKLKSALNTGVRFIYDITDMNVDLTPYYKKAHILPIEQRIFFKQQEFGPMRVQRGRKRQATATITPYQQQVLSAIAKEENEHERFLLSFAPTLARLEPRKQALLKCRMQSLFYDIEFGE
ncbi:unnamed protein product [Boreogadus saida]